MTDPEDLIRAFAAAGPDEKRENFERSTLKLVLGQLGWSAGQIRGAAAEYGPAFGWDWFNEQNLVAVRVGSTRQFRFNLIELLTKPSKHPVVEAFRAFKGADAEPCCMVFHIFEAGRWVATNLATPDDPSVHIATNGLKFNIVSFSKFFSNRWSAPT